MSEILRKRLVPLPYGHRQLMLDLRWHPAEWHLIAPRFPRPLADPGMAFRAAAAEPISSPLLSEIVRPHHRVLLVTSDGTRPVPNRLLISRILEMLPVPDEKVTVLLGNGTHRANTPREIREMFGGELCDRVQIVNHEARDPRELTRVTGPHGESMDLNRRYREADIRIVLGFIEPHFFAGFSGGAKGVVPGIAGMDTILHIHRAELIADSRSTWGVLDGNPVHEAIHRLVSMDPPEFLVNVALDARKRVTGIWCGHYRDAHYAGCAEVGRACMVPVARKFPMVITTNSGYPLDQNLYQSVKGLSAAARIVEPGGTIIIAAECRDGVPDDGEFARILQENRSPEAVLEWVMTRPLTVPDQWQAQILAGVLQRCRVRLVSSLPPGIPETCMMEHVPDLRSAVTSVMREKGAAAEAAIIPHGPLAIPWHREFTLPAEG